MAARPNNNVSIYSLSHWEHSQKQKMCKHTDIWIQTRWKLYFQMALFCFNAGISLKYMFRKWHYSYFPTLGWWQLFDQHLTVSPCKQKFCQFFSWKIVVVSSCILLFLFWVANDVTFLLWILPIISLTFNQEWILFCFVFIEVVVWCRQVRTYDD